MSHGTQSVPLDFAERRWMTRNGIARRGLVGRRVFKMKCMATLSPGTAGMRRGGQSTRRWPTGAYKNVLYNFFC
jgi:hypothetical protein